MSEATISCHAIHPDYQELMPADRIISDSRLDAVVKIGFARTEIHHCGNSMKVFSFRGGATILSDTVPAGCDKTFVIEDYIDGALKPAYNINIVHGK